MDTTKANELIEQAQWARYKASLLRKLATAQYTTPSERRSLQSQARTFDAQALRWDTLAREAIAK